MLQYNLRCPYRNEHNVLKKKNMIFVVGFPLKVKKKKQVFDRCSEIWNIQSCPSSTEFVGQAQMMHSKYNLILHLWSLLHVSHHIWFSWSTYSFDFLLDILFLASNSSLWFLKLSKWTISLPLSWAWSWHGFSCMMLLSVTWCKTAVKLLT